MDSRLYFFRIIFEIINLLEPARWAWWAPKSWLRSETLVLELLIRSFSPVHDLVLAKRKNRQNATSQNLNSASKLDPKPSPPTRVSPSPPRTRFWTFLQRPISLPSVPIFRCLTCVPGQSDHSIDTFPGDDANFAN